MVNARWIAIGCASLGVSSSVASVSYTVFRVEAFTSTGQYGSVEYHASEDGWNAEGTVYTWALAEPIAITDDISGEFLGYCIEGQLVARMDSLCSIRVDMGVLAGSVDTQFIITSPELRFRPIPESQAVARAIASFTVDDIAPNPDYAYIVGLGTPGTGAFRAYINDESKRFSHLIGSVFAGSGATATGAQFDPPVGFRPVGEIVASISTEMAFLLTRDDLAFASGTFDMPEPSPCDGDVDSDADVDFDDLSVLLSQYGTCAGDTQYNEYSDFDGDACVSIPDVAILLSSYGTLCD